MGLKSYSMVWKSDVSLFSFLVFSYFIFYICQAMKFRSILCGAAEKLKLKQMKWQE